MGAESVITCRRNEVEVSRYASYVQRKAYLFHRVFNQATTQRQVFAESITPIISKALEGCVQGRVWLCGCVRAHYALLGEAGSVRAVHLTPRT